MNIKKGNISFFGIIMFGEGKIWKALSFFFFFFFLFVSVCFCLFFCLCLFGVMAPNKPLFLLLFLLFFHHSFSRECDYDSLPNNLNQPGYLAYDGEFHAHSEYFVNLSSPTIPKILFTLEKTSVVRMYIAPNEIELDLALYSNSDLVASSENQIETMVEATLEGGENEYSFHLTHHHGSVEETEGCPSLIMELAIIPRDIQESRVNQMEEVDNACGEGESVPTSMEVFNGLSQSSPIHFNSDLQGFSFNAVSQPPTTTNSPPRVIEKLPFTIPLGVGRQNLWVFKATLRTDFVVGGSLGMTVTSAGVEELSRECMVSGECEPSRALMMNSKSVRDIKGPGDYILWFYDLLEFRDPELASCSPFSFELEMFPVGEEEDFVNCPALRLPLILNAPGLLEGGYLNYFESVFLDVGGTATIRFFLVDDSFFRVLIEDHEVDIDVSLSKKDEHGSYNVIQSSSRILGQDAIQSYLEPGSYHLTYQFYGSSELDFCQTFDTRIAIAPAEAIPRSPCSKRSDPDLSGMSQLAVANSYNLDRDSSATFYTFPYEGDYSTRVIVEKEFSLSQSFRAEVIAYAYFLTGDVSLELISLGEEGNVVTIGYHKRNRVEIVDHLEAGDYVLRVLTGVRDSLSSEEVDHLIANTFPDCLKYELEIHFIPEEVTLDPLNSPSVYANPDHCPIRFFPKDLMSVEFMGIDNQMHIQEPFRYTFDHTFHSQQDSFFNTQNDDLVFRMFATPEYHDDVDFILFELSNDGTEVEVGRSKSQLKEKEMVVRLKRETNYHFQISIEGLPDASSFGCLFFDLELAIFPFFSGDPNDCEVKDPSTLLSGEPLPWEDLGDNYNFPQTSEVFSVLVAFSLDKPTYFTAIITYDFTWNDMYLRLYDFDKDNEAPESLAIGVTRFNRNVLEPVLLNPGDYALYIIEPSVVNSDLRRCAEYALSVSAKVASSAEVDSVNRDFLLGCGGDYLPQSWNGNGWLSSLSGNQLHLQYPVLVDVTTRVEKVQFSVGEKSAFRVYVPPHSQFDVDLRLMHGTLDKPGVFIESCVSPGDQEETMVQTLDVGSYVLQVNIFDLSNELGSFEGKDCPSFPMEVAIAPISYVTSNPIASQECENGELVLVPNQRVEFSVKFSRGSDSQFSATFASFEVKEKSYLDFEVGFDFLTADTQVILTGELSSGSAVTFYGTPATNHRFLKLVLSAGTYTISIHDPGVVSSGSIDALECVFLYFNYFIDVNGIPDDVVLCEENFPFPRNCYSDHGGSEAYGGNQDKETGEVWVRGDEFLLPAQGDVFSFRFLIKKPSFLKVNMWGEHQENLQMVLYNDESSGEIETVSKPLRSGPVESLFIQLDPKESTERPFLLDVEVKDRSQSPRCAYFSFDFEISTVEDAQSLFECPKQLPDSELPLDHTVPENYLEVTPGETFVLPLAGYVLTKERSSADELVNGYYIHTIVISSSDKMVSLVAEAKFNFIETDISLVLRSGDTLLAASIPSIPKNSLDQANMGAKLGALLGEQEYQLDIYISTKQYAKIFDEDGEWCLPFLFSMSVVASVGDAPSIIGVSPTAGSGFSSLSDLTISVDFSVPIADPPLATLDEDIIGGPIFYLAPKNNRPPQIAPISVEHNDNGDEVTLIFDHQQLRPGMKYSLRMLGGVLKADDGQEFLPLFPVEYSMEDCNCNGHGVCDPESEEMACICDDHFNPPYCVECASGFHRVGGVCVADEVCTDDFCDAFQPCDDTGGIATCQCSEAYAGPKCERCANGYDGYPDCVPLAWIGGGRPKGCQAPILPASLGTIGYLGSDHGAGVGKLHFQNQYYVPKPLVVGGDAVHEMDFSLHQKSLVRVSATADVTELSVSLLLVVDGTDGQEEQVHAISSEYKSGKSTVLYQELAGSSTRPKHYRISFYFFENVVVDPTTCETFDLEFEISPMTDVEGDLLVREPLLCGGSDSPFDKYHSSVSSPYKMMHGLHFSIDKDEVFNVKNTPYDGVFAFVPFEQFLFDLLDSNRDDKVALLQVEIGDFFLTGEIGVGVVRGTSMQLCSVDGSNEDCVFGERILGRTILEAVLEPGFTYTLFLYEPHPQMRTAYEGEEIPFTACAPYEFKMEVTWTEKSIERCNLPLPPSNLFPESPELIDFPHYSGQFALVSESHLYFNATTTSTFRVGVESDHTITLRVFDSSLENLHGDRVVGGEEGASSLFLTMPKGEFVLEVESLDAAVVSQDSCPSFRMEVAMAGTKSEYVKPLNCAEMGEVDIPPFTRLPYMYSEEETVLYRGVPNRESAIFAFDFEPDQDAILSLTLLNDFLPADLSARLVNHGVVANGSSSKSETGPLKTYSYNALDVRREVSGGSSYTLELYAAEDVYGHEDCVRFGLQLSIKAKKENQEVCAQSESLSSSLDTIQFLRPPLHSFHFKNDNLAVPDYSTTNLAYFTTLFTSPLDNPSTFRMFLSFESIQITVLLRDMASFDVVASFEGEVFDDDEGASPGAALKALLYPGTTYAIEYVFDNTELATPLQCPTFSLEMTLHPAPNAPSQCPNGGADHWGSSTLGGTTTRDGLYFQQKLGEQREHTYSLAKQTSPFDVFIQADFDFSEGQMEMVLEDVYNGFVIRSVEGLNSAMLSASNLPAGTYTLTVMEVTAPLSGFAGCSEFSLFFQAEKASASLSLLTTPPVTLNYLPFLDYSSEVNLQGFLVLPVGETKIAFKTKELSNLRVVVYTHETALEELILSLSPSSGAVTTKFSEGGWEYTMLDAELKADTKYNLVYDVRVVDESLKRVDVLSVFSAISIVPSEHFYDPVTCTKPTPIPPVTINEKLQSYMWSSSVQVPIPHEEQRTVVDTLSINVAVPSKIFVTAEFNFPVDEITLELYDCDCDQEDGVGSILAVGSRYFDHSSLDEVVQPGMYHLRIVSVQPTDYYSSCAEFDFFISVHESTSDFSVCSSLDTLPSNLNDKEGTERYGGAMDEDGYLHFSYPEFYVDTTPGVIETQITITELSYVSVYVHSQSVVTVATELHVKKSNGKIVSAPIVRSNSSKGMSFMVWKTGDKGARLHTLSIYLGVQTKFSGCPYFGLDIKVFPVEELRKEIVCEEWETLGFGEDQQLVIGEDGVGRYGGADYFLWKDLNEMRELHFDILQSSLLTMSIGFDSLISTWSITLEKPSLVDEEEEVEKIEESSSLLAYEETSSQVNLYTTLTSSLTEPGRYILRLTRNVWDKKGSPEESTCEPQVWSMLVVPEGALETRALVYRVEPSQALGVAPEGEMKVVVEFSGEVYGTEEVEEEEGTETITERREVTGENILKAFVLRSVDDNTGPKEPEEESDDKWDEGEKEEKEEEEGKEDEGKEEEGKEEEGKEEEGKEEEEGETEIYKEPLLVEPLWVEGEGRYWIMAFDELRGGRKFKLELNGGVLFGDEGEGVVLVGEHYYSVLDPWCGGRGKVKEGAGFCMCEEGYAGRNCRECAQGWELVGRKGERGEAMCEEMEEEKTVGVGGVLAGVVFVGSLLGLAVVWVKKRRADPFKGAFSWEEEGGGTLLTEEGLDGDALMIEEGEEGEEGGGGLFDGLGEEEGEEDGGGNEDFFLSSSSEDSLLN